MGVETKLRYPRKAEIERAVAAARACGLDVAGFEVSPAGTIRIVDARVAAAPAAAASDFDRLKDEL